MPFRVVVTYEDSGEREIELRSELDMYLLGRLWDVMQHGKAFEHYIDAELTDN